LHANLDSFERAKTNIGDQFSRSRGGQEEGGLILGSVLLTSQCGIQVLEVFVEAVFAGTLHGVTHEGRAPTSEDTSKAFTSVNLAPCLDVALVELRVDLSSALDEIERSHSRVSCTLLPISYDFSAVAQQLTHARIPPTTHAA